MRKRKVLKPSISGTNMPRKVITYERKEETADHEDGFDADVESILDAPLDED